MAILRSVSIGVFAVAIALGQGSVQLEDGRRIKGEVVESADRVVVVTSAGEIHDYARALILEVKAGRPLKKRIQERLDAVDAADVDAVMEVAEWAWERVSYRSDAKRLALRVLARDADHAQARAFLGHVRALGRWFPKERDAARAVAKAMREEGRRKQGQGWALPEDLRDLKADPTAWMIDDHRWRRVAEVMAERGCVEWKGRWYPPEEQDMLGLCGKLHERLGVVTHAAMKGAVRAWDVRGREGAEEVADKMDATRRWFAKTFEDPGSATAPIARYVILESYSHFTAFLDQCADVHRLRKDIAEQCKSVQGNPSVGAPFGDLDGVNHLVEGGPPIHLMVSGLGSQLLNRLWAGSWKALPPWISRASSLHAEVAILGKALVLQSDQDEYDRGNDYHGMEGENLKAAKENLRQKLRSGSLSLREVFSAGAATTTGDHDTYGAILLVWFLEQKKEAFFAYLREVDQDPDRERRFQRHFGTTYEELETEFLAWLRT